MQLGIEKMAGEKIQAHGPYRYSKRDHLFSSALRVVSQSGQIVV